jgi:hypothetical protein
MGISINLTDARMVVCSGNDKMTQMILVYHQDINDLKIYIYMSKSALSLTMRSIYVEFMKM